METATTSGMQQRQIPWLWILLAALVLAPVPAARFFLDLLGGVALALLLLSVGLATAGFVAWKLVQRQLRSCEVCGFTAVGWEVCPACGAPWRDMAASASEASAIPELDARDVTIDVEVLADEQ